MTEPTLRQKLDAVIQEHVNATILVPGRRHPQFRLDVSLSLQEIQSLAEMLREDEPPDTTGSYPGSYAITHVACDTRYSVTGPGIHNRHDVPVFERESDAESMCRCLGLAFRAGQRQRSKALMRLLDEDQ